MTGRTHDLAGFTAMTYVISVASLHEMSLATALVAFSANMIGALAPDIDQSTAALYRKIRGGSLLSKFISPLLGGHRFLSHSLLGIFAFGFLVDKLLKAASNVLIVDMQIVWWAFMIGFVSHLIMDIITRDGIPLLFPIPIRLGIPPFRFLRLKTGGIVEKTFIFPSLIIANIYIIYHNYSKFLDFVKHYIK